MLDVLKSIPHYLIPQHLISRIMGLLANAKNTRLKNFIIKLFIKRYGVNMAEAAQEKVDAYPDFNHFFIRSLKAGVRPIVDGENTIACPVDGVVSQIGHINGSQIVQAKKRKFSLLELMGGDNRKTESFVGGKFATIYLAPKDYHRVHIPCSGELKDMIYVPGKLFSVQPLTVRAVPNLFARNERVICLFETVFGSMAVILVGAVIVASINTAWHGTVTPSKGQDIRQWHYPNVKTPTIQLAKGEEMGHFKLGSTAIVLFENPDIQWDDQVTTGSSVQLGQLLAQINTP